MSITIILADDHPLLLSGIEHFLKSKNFFILDAVLDGNTAYNKILKNNPDIAILDFDMPKRNGIEIAQLCKQKRLTTKIIILTLYKQEAILQEVGKTIQGYVLKDDAISELEHCIVQVAKGQTYISKNLGESIHLSSQSSEIKNLTVSEMKVLHYLSKDLSSSEIAEMLFISKRTVEKHRSNIIQKLKIKSSQNALLLWVQKNHQFFNT